MKYEITSSAISDDNLQRAKEINIRKAKAMFQSFPIATKIWLATRLNMPLSFIANNWEEIIE